MLHLLHGVEGWVLRQGGKRASMAKTNILRVAVVIVAVFAALGSVMIMGTKRVQAAFPGPYGQNGKIAFAHLNDPPIGSMTPDGERTGPLTTGGSGGDFDYYPGWLIAMINFATKVGDLTRP
jgi:hypothetical protein